LSHQFRNHGSKALGTIIANALASMMRTNVVTLQPGVTMCPMLQGALPLQLSSGKFKITKRGTERMAPPVGLLPLLRWAWGSLSVPCRQGTPTTDIKIRQHVEHATMSRCVFRGSRPHLPTREGSGAVTCSTAPDLASECSSAATHPMALDPASLLGRASASPRVIHLRTPPPRWRGLQCRHMSSSSLRAIGRRNKERHTHVFPRHACMVPRLGHTVLRRTRQSR
jgi:hypothetical protein